jgi:hypothetical protein
LTARAAAVTLTDTTTGIGRATPDIPASAVRAEGAAIFSRGMKRKAAVADTACS